MRKSEVKQTFLFFLRQKTVFFLFWYRSRNILKLLKREKEAFRFLTSAQKMKLGG